MRPRILEAHRQLRPQYIRNRLSDHSLPSLPCPRHTPIYHLLHWRPRGGGDTLLRPICRRPNERQQQLPGYELQNEIQINTKLTASNYHQKFSPEVITRECTRASA